MRYGTPAIGIDRIEDAFIFHVREACRFCVKVFELRGQCVNILFPCLVFVKKHGQPISSTNYRFVVQPKLKHSTVYVFGERDLKIIMFIRLISGVTLLIGSVGPAVLVIYALVTKIVPNNLTDFLILLVTVAIWPGLVLRLFPKLLQRAESLGWSALTRRRPIARLTSDQIELYHFMGALLQRLRVGATASDSILSEDVRLADIERDLRRFVFYQDPIMLGEAK